MMWLLLALLSALSLGTGWALAEWRRTMTRSDWWSLVLASLLLGGTLAYMLVVATGT